MSQTQEKETIIITFSGGRTSAYMWWWLNTYMSHLYNFVTVYANTGLEHQATLRFVYLCDRYFGMNLVWLEAVVNQEKGEGTKHKIVNYWNASRKGEPMEEVIKKYGLPNRTYIHCTREAKLRPIESYKKSIGLSKARNAVGIRYDEFHRVKNNPLIIYPLTAITKRSKLEILNFWKQMPFDLELEEHNGNCMGCYKKSDYKLKMTADENPSHFDFWVDMENKYGDVITKDEEHRRVIYRGYRTAKDVQNNLKLPKQLTSSDECPEECGSVISDYIAIEAHKNLFAWKTA